MFAHRSETHILKNLPFRTARKLSSTMVKHLDDPTTDDTAFLITPAHVSTPAVDCQRIRFLLRQVHWTMECIGHTFTLPMDDAEKVLGALKIYSRWCALK